MNKFAWLGFLGGLAGAGPVFGFVIPLADRVPCVVADRQDFEMPDRVRLDGWIGARIAGNEDVRLVNLDINRLLEGYRHRPGRQSWDGEHVGKWLHAATLAWVNTGDPKLRAKLDEAAAELARCQLADGYLGTYVPKDRWTEWDVWAHKYNLIGLLTYVHFTGNTAPLETCRRMGDLLCRTFGDRPGQRDLIEAGYHAGMAPTSVLEPMVLLYRMTGEKRYLDFCRYILRAWEQPNGPHLVSRLRDHQGVNRVGNAKAYEMLSCLNGALELYRTTGERELLAAGLNAWQDIVDNQLYLAGAASVRERFTADHELPATDAVGETCVTVTWLQVNAQLLRLTGEARFAEQLERVVLNQLLGAQQPDGAAWGYYVQMEGKKLYTATLDGQCCLSSGPRGVALIPTFAVATDGDGVVVNLYDDGRASLVLRDGTAVALAADTLYPADGGIRLTLTPAQSHGFSLKLRIPAWCRDASARVNGAGVPLARGADGYAAIRREWRAGDTVELQLPLRARVVLGDHLEAGRAAILYGPLVLAADEALLAGTGQRVSTISLPATDPVELGVTPVPEPEAVRTWPHALAFRVRVVAGASAPAVEKGDVIATPLIPFADAGGTGSRYRMWLPLTGSIRNPNLLLTGQASCSDPNFDATGVNDDDGHDRGWVEETPRAGEIWFAVVLEKPVAMRRIVFVHGRTEDDGGWFDASAGKPRVQIRRTVHGEWETVGALADYPATTAREAGSLDAGRRFELRLPATVTAEAVRIIGVPACGNRPESSAASCSELQAFAE
ncbi:MAG TPA: beta-L-arabinofuranosidase domain-containing protein [Candidatus Didemnitutus sp.]|jgi:hypothetical protein